MAYVTYFITIATVVTVARSLTITMDVREEYDRGTHVGNVAELSNMKKIFPNAQEFKTLTYAFTSEDPNTKLFHIMQENGQIYTATRIDREQICDFRILECVVILSVGVKSSMDYRVVRVQVTIHDINDNAPRFPSEEITMDIPESAVVGGEGFTIAGAVDNDSPINSIEVYKMDYNKYFEIRTLDSLEGNLYPGLVVRQNLDRESVSHHKLIITAEDSGKPKLTGTLTINVIVTDVNDHKPVFSSNKYNVSLVESTNTGRTVITLNAIDLDAGKNSEIRYAFGSQTPREVKQTFSINTKSGAIILQSPLDYETKSKYSFVVIASDNGPQSRSSSTIVTVEVIDVNDEVPKISFTNLNAGSAEISESSPAGKFVTHMSVLDKDSGQNGDVTCYLDTDAFRLRPIKGTKNDFTILLNKRLDREKQDEYHVKVTCQDAGQPSLYGSKTLRVNVLDSNDNAPKFSKKVYQTSIMENSPRGMSVITVDATDRDIGDNGKFVYELHGQDKRYFDIDEQTGLITIANPIDREQIPEVQLLIIAKDMGTPTELYDQASVVIYVKDISDESPAFGKTEYKFTVTETTQSNVSIGSVFAMDLDTGPAGEVRYTIEASSNENNMFRISYKDGTIYSNSALDRELDDEYKLVVIATDLGDEPLSSSVEVYITVSDINDNAPNISFPNDINDTFTILHSAMVNSLVLHITATDADDKINAMLVYQIKHGNQEGLFRLDGASGDLVVAQAMSKQECSTYDMLVAVQDRGTTSQYAEINFKIVVLLDNTTLGLIDPKSRDSKNQQRNEEKNGFNIVIIIIIVIATAISCCLIIIAIVCVVRRDRSRRFSDKPEEVDVIVQKGDKFAVAPANLDKLDNVNDKCKKEVSFSLEDLQNSQNNSFSTFKGQGINNKPYSDIPNGNYIALTRSSPIPNHYTDTDRYVENNGSCIKMQNYAPPNEWSHIHPPHTEMRYLVDYLPRDDSTSDLSGEAAMSDSGRGGSEESFSRSTTFQPPTSQPLTSQSATIQPATVHLPTSQRYPSIRNQPRQREGVSYMSFEGVDSYVPMMEVSPTLKHGSTLPRDHRSDVNRGSNQDLYSRTNGASPTLTRNRNNANVAKFNAPLGTTNLIENIMKNNNHRNNDIMAKNNNQNLQLKGNNICCLNPDEKYGVEETGYGTVADSTDCYSLSDGETLKNDPMDYTMNDPNHPMHYRMHDPSRYNDPSKYNIHDPNQQYTHDPNQQYVHDPNQQYIHDPNYQYNVHDPHHPNHQYNMDTSFLTSEDGTIRDDDTATTTSGSYNISNDDIEYPVDTHAKLKDVLV